MAKMTVIQDRNKQFTVKFAESLICVESSGIDEIKIETSPDQMKILEMRQQIIKVSTVSYGFEIMLSI